MVYSKDYDRKVEEEIQLRFAAELQRTAAQLEQHKKEVSQVSKPKK